MFVHKICGKGVQRKMLGLFRRASPDLKTRLVEQIRAQSNTAQRKSVYFLKSLTIRPTYGVRVMNHQQPIRCQGFFLKRKLYVQYLIKPPTEHYAKQ